MTPWITSVCRRSNATMVDVDELLSKPTWSVESLLPSEAHVADSKSIFPYQLRHLLRLSALPAPNNSNEEAKMLETLAAQLHFVKEIQKVDTRRVAPLRSLRDETVEAEAENEISLETLKDALAKEEMVGKHHKRIRRKQELPVDTRGAEDWDVLGHAERKIGRYFVVDSVKE